MNLVEATVAKIDNGMDVRLDSGDQLRLPRTRPSITVGQRIVVGVRPEHLNVSGEGTEFSGTVLQTEPTGAQTFVLFSFNGAQLTAVADGEVAIRPGDVSARSFARNTSTYSIMRRAIGYRPCSRRP